MPCYVRPGPVQPSHATPSRYDATMTPPQEPAGQHVTAITIRLPEDIYEDLRREAFDKRTSMNALIVDAVRARKRD